MVHWTVACSRLNLNDRYNDPELGMFIQPDWWEVRKPGVGTNRHAYSFGNPVNKMDPGGLCCTNRLTAGLPLSPDRPILRPS